ncbi:energy transducer TonB [Chitinimonas lacunae]|uniref:Energy transducer TonB n=1 Tax=Chitinimonas lacunae TaxID=1963018 RepID=A0ABV8MRH7_9NEIS
MLLLLAACATPPAPAPAAKAPVPVAAPQPAVPAAAPVDPLPDYIDKVRRQIRGNMLYRSKSGNPEAMFEISLRPDMSIVSVKRIRASGDAAFDRAVQRAIEKMRKYPPLPAGVEFSLFEKHKIKYRLHENR